MDYVWRTLEKLRNSSEVVTGSWTQCLLVARRSWRALSEFSRYPLLVFSCVRRLSSLNVLLYSKQLKKIPEVGHFFDLRYYFVLLGCRGWVNDKVQQGPSRIKCNLNLGYLSVLFIFPRNKCEATASHTGCPSLEWNVLYMLWAERARGRRVTRATDRSPTPEVLAPLLQLSSPSMLCAATLRRHCLWARLHTTKSIFNLHGSDIHIMRAMQYFRNFVVLWYNCIY